MKRHKLDKFEQDVLNSCKVQIKIHTEMLLERNIRPSNIEIELIHYLKKIIYND